MIYFSLRFWVDEALKRGRKYFGFWLYSERAENQYYIGVEIL